MASASEFEPVESNLHRAFRRDRNRFRQQLRTMKRDQAAGKPFDRRLTRLLADLDRSIAQRESRIRDVPPIRYDEDLPISARRVEIAAAIRDHQVVIVCGETGSGKSTQLPKICLELGRGDRRADRPYAAAPDRRPERGRADRRGNRLALGPRRGLQGPLLPRAIGPQSYIKLMTDGILLAESQSDPLLGTVRHDHSRRGPRAVAEHRFSDRHPQTAVAAAARPEADHHFGDHRCGPLCRAFRHGGRAGAGDRGLGPDVSGRGPLPADGARWSLARSPTAEQAVRGGRGRSGPPRRGDMLHLHAHRAGDPRDGQDARADTADPRRQPRAARRRSCRFTRGCRSPSSSGSSSRTATGGS